MISSGHLLFISYHTQLFHCRLQRRKSNMGQAKATSSPLPSEEDVHASGGDDSSSKHHFIALFAFVHVWAPNVWKTYLCIVFLFLGLSWFLSLLLTVFFHCTSICFADAICAFLYRREQSESGKTQGLNGKKKGINKPENLVFYQCLSIVLKHFDVMIVCRFCDF